MERVVVCPQKISLFYHYYDYRNHFAEKIAIIDHQKRLYIDPWLLSRIMDHHCFILKDKTFVRILDRVKRDGYSVAWPGSKKRNARINIYDLDFTQDSDLLGTIMDSIQREDIRLWDTSLSFQDVVRIWSNQYLVECLDRKWNVPTINLLNGKFDKIRFDLTVDICWIPWTGDWKHSISSRAIFSFLITIPGLFDYLFTNFEPELKQFVPDHPRMLSWVRGECL